MTCKDCIHCALCESRCRNQYENGECDYCYSYFCEVKNTAEKCPSFKDKSRFIELPCKLGDTVYRTGFISDGVSFAKVGITNHIFNLRFYLRFKNEFGKTVFLTREEAEQALKERENNA